MNSLKADPFLYLLKFMEQCIESETVTPTGGEIGYIHILVSEIKAKNIID